MSSEQACRVCETLPPPRVAELDELMGDPRRWKMLVAFGTMPPAQLTPFARKLGAANVGTEWLRTNGYVELSRRDALRHYTRHTPIIASTLEEYAAFALAGDSRTPKQAEDRLKGTAAAGELYNAGIDLANMSLRILQARLEDRLREDPASVPSAELMAYADYGKQLAISAASLKRAGHSPFGSEKDVYDGFRGGDGAPSQRMGHHRVRVVDGESRPITDEGPKDRAEYNARALTEGREGL